MLPGGAALTGATDQCRTVARARGLPHRPGTSPLALRLPGLLTSAVSSPGQGVCPAAREPPRWRCAYRATDQRRIVARARGLPRRPGTSPVALRLPGLLTSAVPSPGQGVYPAARDKYA
ncbi:TPA: hypothetical protein ACTW2S_005379 [Raoultella planticola]